VSGNTSKDLHRKLSFIGLLVVKLSFRIKENGHTKPKFEYFEEVCHRLILYLNLINRRESCKEKLLGNEFNKFNFKNYFVVVGCQSF
jgi:hypothetical protein